MTEDTPLAAPVAKRKAHAMMHHGHTRVDHYYWLRDDERKDPEMLDYLARENNYTQKRLAHTEDRQEMLFEEIKGRIKKDDSSVPYLRDGNWYYHRYEQGREYPIYCRKIASLDAAEEIVLDVNIEAEKHAYYRATGLTLSDDQHLLAYGEDKISRRIYTLRVKDLRTGELLSDTIPATSGSYEWAADDNTLFYVQLEEETLRPFQLWKHRLGSNPDEDVLVFEEEDDTFGIYITRSKSREYLILQSESTLVSEARILPAADPESAFVQFLPREANHEYRIDHALGSFFVRTNHQAKNFRLVRVAPGHTQDKSAWQDVVPARDDVLFENFELFQDELVVSERRGGLVGLRVIPWSDPAAAYDIDFGEEVYVSGLETNYELNTKSLRYTYQSLATPASVFDFDMDTRQKVLRKQEEVLGGFQSDNYLTERHWATARDGTKIPISLVYRKDLRRSGVQPLYQYGYGSYGASMDPWFSASRISLLDRGVIYAMVHIRGGEEMGRWWYDNGKLLHKRNTFTDFIDCSKYLIETGMTDENHLIASGGSAGGLLVGAVANIAPALYKAIIANVPFVDVVTTMLDESIPLTTFEYDEWGNPNEKQYYDYMLSYSPYDQIKKQDYPHLLVLTGLHDSQVQYWEPAKWVAKLRHHKSDDNRLLLHTNMEAGHGGASGRFRRFRETAMEYAFVFDLLGIKER